MARATDNSGSTHYNPGASGIGELVWHNDQSHRTMRKVMSVFEELDDFLRHLGRLTLETDDGAAHYAGHINRGQAASKMARDSFEYMARATDNSGSTHYNPGASGIGELVWHNDQSHRPMRKVMSVFEALDVEDDVVPTEYRDMYTACETLPHELRAALEHRVVAYYDPRLPGPDEMPRLADANHPVLTPHPHTGRRTVYVNDFADRIVGLTRAESDDLIGRLRAHIDASAPRYVHEWRTGDMLWWDNLGLQHRRDPVPGGQQRAMRQHGGLAE
jgi:alpha-ketoglutarate-dependent taurine dioxygenase